jgi:outer membrane receptor for ferrienterochelin and colicin
MEIKKLRYRKAGQLKLSALAVAFAATFYGGSVLAQSTTGSIFGTVPVAAGETVLVQGGAGINREVAVDANGHYSVSSLPVGTYTVTLRRDGATIDSRKDITLRVGSGTEVSFATAASAASATNLGTVSVSASALPSIDVTQVDSRTVITSQQLAVLPVARSAEAIALLAPGAVQGSSNPNLAGPNGNSLVSFGGASVTENAYYINGMNVTDPKSGLGGIELPYGSVEQQEVLTGGYSAMYGRSDGGVINQIGKRGSNEWHFGGQLLFTPEWGMSSPSNTYYPQVDGSNLAGSLYRYRRNNKNWEEVASAYVGGPLIKDKLFFFASMEGDRRNGHSTGSVGSPYTTNYKYDDPKWYAKLDWNINDSNILELTGASTKHSYNGNLYDYDYSQGSHGVRGDFYDTDTHTKTSSDMWIAKYTSYITDDLTLTAQFGKQKTDIYTQLPESFDPSLDYVSGTSFNSYANPALYSGSFASIPRKQSVRTTSDPSNQTKASNYRVDLSYHLGDHTIAVGIDNQTTQDLNDGDYVPTDDGYAWYYGQAGSPDKAISSLVGATGPAGGSAGYYAYKYRYVTAASVQVKQRAQYIEDTWQVNDRLMLKLGLRNDQFTNYNSDGEPYINQHKPQWAPRLGASWDVFGDSSFRVYGNAGRYYLALPTSLALRGASGSYYTSQYYTYTGIDPSTGYPTGLQPINTSRGLGAEISSDNEYGQSPDPKTITATNLKAQYQDEYILGFDKTLDFLDTKWTYGAKATVRKLRNLIDDTCNSELFTAKADAEGIPTDNLRGCYFINPGRSATFNLVDGNGGYDQLHFSSAELGLPHPKRNYTSLELYLEHPFDGKWWGKIDYLWSHSYGNSEGQVRSDIGQADVAATEDWDMPQLMSYSNGALANDRRHQIKFFGAYRITPEWTVSGNLTLASGLPRNCLGYYGPGETDPTGYAANNNGAYHWCGGRPSAPGKAGRSSWMHLLSLQGEYRPNFANNKLAFSLMVSNLLNEKKAVQFSPYYGQTGALEPSYGLEEYYEDPRYIRFGITYDY